MVDVAVVGAAGYAGIEAVRLVLGHPEMRLVAATSAADEGRPIAEVYPALTGATDLAFTAPDAGTVGSLASVAFLSVPHTAAMALVPDLLLREVTVVDLSADFRLKDVEVYESWYEVEHVIPELLDEAVYGLPELNRAAIPGSRLVACPGCYPTASLLAAAPAFETGVCAADQIVIDAKSGVSGAGRSPSPGVHFCTVNENLAPYKVAGHRHTPEIEQGLTQVAGRDIFVTFTPHLVPMTRGLLATAYLPLHEAMTTDEAVTLYAERYADEPFVHVSPAGRMPGTNEVSGSNRAHIGVAVDERTGMLIVACAIDNLIKGSSGQAIQCANIVLGMDETAGLDQPSAVV